MPRVKKEKTNPTPAEIAKIKYEGDPISFLITPELLKTILAETLTCTCGEKMMKFAGEDWEYVVMLRYTK